MTRVAVFVNQGEGGRSDAVAMIILDPALIEVDGTIVPAIGLEPWAARSLADALNRLADEVE